MTLLTYAYLSFFLNDLPVVISAFFLKYDLPVICST